MRRIVMILLAVAALARPGWVGAATGITSCEVGKSCVVGEFLYDDTYTPITTATCTLTSRYPDGTSFLNSQALTSTSDGWYAHNFTAPATTGTYRSQICCTSGSDYLCLDKSFNVVTAAVTQADVTTAVWDATRSAHTSSGTFGEALQNVVPSGSDIASATWNYSSRSLSTFGNLVSDIWGNSSRTLSGFGTLIADIWGSTSSTKSDLTALTKTVNQTRNLLEQLVNKPVVETTTEEVPDLSAKIQETEGITSQLFADVEFAKSQADLFKLRWEKLTDEEAMESAQTLTRKFGGQNDTAGAGSIFGEVAYLSDSWDWSPVTTAKTQAETIKDVLVSLARELESSGRSKVAFGQVKALAGLLGQLDGVVGDATNKKEQKTLFGKLAETKFLVATLAAKEADFQGILSSWDNSTLAIRQKKLADLATEVAAVNRIPSVGLKLLAATPVQEKELRNKGYFLSGIISANQKLLAGKAGRSLSSTWLELGSIVFKSLVTNPSALISQKVTVNYYLPPEVKQDNIISVDDGLSVKYDTAKDQYFVTGEFLLAPSETRTVAVRVADIWTISFEEVDSLRKQAAALSAPLEKTSYFAQGVTLKSDIDVSLDKVLLLSKSTSTPETKIKSYREAGIEMAAVREKLSKLKELAAQAGSVGTIFGFVGGAQTLAVWGLILILAVGFVFLALYMKVLIKKEEATPVVSKKRLVPAAPPVYSGHRPNFGLVAILILTLGIGLFAGIALGRSNSSTSSQVLGQTATQELKR